MTKYYYNLDVNSIYQVRYEFENDIVLQVPLNYQKGLSNKTTSFVEYWWFKLPEYFENLAIKKETVICVGHTIKDRENLIWEFLTLLKSGHFEDGLEITNADGVSKFMQYNKGLYDMVNKIEEWWEENLE